MRTTLGIGWTWPTHRDTYRQGFDPAALRAWATVEVEVEHVGSDQELAEAVFIATNTYSGSLWEDIIEPALPSSRPHTSLSVGDVVKVDGRLWSCESVGWTPREQASAAVAS